MRTTLDHTNPDYFHLVRDRMENKTALDCFKQCRRLLQEHAPIGTCLDVGCASGYLYFHLSDVIGEYHGVDASARFVEYGREQFAQERADNATLHHSWFEDFTLPCGFDALVCLGLFYVFPNYHRPLHQMMQLTDKAIVIRALFAEQTCYRYVPENPGSPYWTYYNIYSKREISSFVESHGWSAAWHEDDYVQSIGGHYETAGLPFPFKFLVLTRKEK